MRNPQLSWLAPIWLGITVLHIHALATSQSLKLSQVPPAVRKTIAQQTKAEGTVLVGLQRISRANRELYSAQLQTNRNSRTMILERTGAIVEIREPIALSHVSPEAKKVIQSSVGNGEILQLESVKLTSGLIAAYRLRFTRAGKDSELRIAPNGKLAPD
jgi:hypothetical protein